MSGDFDQWMKAVDKELVRRIGLETADLPDASFYDWFEDEITPAQAARLLIEAGP